MLTLHLIRHAKTNQQSATGKDVDRALLPKGIAQAQVLGEHIRVHRIDLGKIVCSSATRTRETYELLHAKIAIDYSVTYSPDAYLASAHELRQLLLNNTGTIQTLIGHNEGLSDLACYFLDEFIHLKTADFITITFPFDDWKMVIRGTGMLTGRFRPEVAVR